MFLDWLELPTSHLPELNSFYGGLLGLPVERAGGTVSVTVGASTLRFVEAAAPAFPFHFAFNVPPSQFADAVAWLETRTPPIRYETGETSGHSDNWNADMVYFRDPAGHIGELIARHDSPVATSTPCGPASLLNVSEIGLAVADVLAAARLLEGAGVPLYRCDLNSSFLSMGDEQGLFIVVAAGRLWFPDRVTPAVPQPLRVGFRQGDRSFTLSAGADGGLTLA